MCDTGLLLDPVYTGKAMMGLVQKIQERPERFRGDRILFIHTGEGVLCVVSWVMGLCCAPLVLACH
jgi:1-aminocyclopropane-1-carboxylate deaminase/D-cysteine desulfhydrase-like pyridoxal-dependent ACC family enzyme